MESEPFAGEDYENGEVDPEKESKKGGTSKTEEKPVDKVAEDSPKPVA